MAKKIQLKDSSSRLVVKGIGTVDNNNIDPFLLNRLKEINPAYGEMFHEVEVEEPKPKEKAKSLTKNSNASDV